MAVPADSTRASRRLFLAAGPCAAVFGALAAATAAAPDPVHAAIAAHRAAARTLEDAARRAENPANAAARAAHEAAIDAELDALDAFATTPPVTRAGIRAMLAYAIEIDDGGAPIAGALLRSPALAV